jgi:hypothetical protein
MVALLGISIECVLRRPLERTVTYKIKRSIEGRTRSTAIAIWPFGANALENAAISTVHSC